MFCVILSIVCIKANDSAQFRGFAVQPREASTEFSESPEDQNSVGEFTNVPPSGPGAWQIWSCPIQVIMSDYAQNAITFRKWLTN